MKLTTYACVTDSELITGEERDGYGGRQPCCEAESGQEMCLELRSRFFIICSKVRPACTQAQQQQEKLTRNVIFFQTLLSSLLFTS